VVAKDIKTFRDHQYVQLANSFLSGVADSYLLLCQVSHYPFLVVAAVVVVVVLRFEAEGDLH
jgi:uncharacterized membrane protein YoaK (UPF0700 family)